MSAGNSVHLHIMRNGLFHDLVLSDEYIKSQIWSISYAGKDKIWISSRLGHRENGHVLVNLTTGKIEQRKDNLGGGEYKRVKEVK